MSHTDSASPINTIIIKIILHTYLPNKKKDEKDTIVFNSTLNDDIADMPCRKADTA